MVKSPYGRKSGIEQNSTDSRLGGSFPSSFLHPKQQVS